MQSLASQPAAARYEPLTRGLVRVVQALGLALREYLALSRQRMERQRGELPDRLTYMNVRMLKDVGAPDWMIDRAVVERQQGWAIHQ